MTFHIKQREPLADGLRRIAREQIGIVFRDFADEQCDMHERIHSLRARCKKLRALLRLPGPLMATTFEVEDKRLHDAGKRLAAMRDAQVRVQTIAALGEAEPLAHLESVEAVTNAVDQSLADLRETLAAVDAWPLGIEGFCDIAPGFARTFRSCRSAWELARQEPSDEHFHELRKWTKNHWYQIRILERLNKPVLRKRRQALNRLARLLGEAHDLALLEATAQGNTLGGKAAKRKQKHYEEAQILAQKLYATDTDELVADMSRWWADWRE